MIDEQAIAARLAAVNDRIRQAAQRVGRNPSEVTLVAVSKTQPLEAVQAAYLAGVRHFGENRVEEGREKVPAFGQWWENQVDAADPPHWHMIGHIQHRKARDAIRDYQLIHSVDSLKLAQRMNRLSDPNHRVPILLECNVSGESGKFGFPLAEWNKDGAWRNELLDTFRQILDLPNLKIMGLMTMAPIVSDPEEARPVFVGLRAARDFLRQELAEADWRHLSMGMTDDFEVAVEEGATLVRVGRAIFGERN